MARSLGWDPGARGGRPELTPREFIQQYGEQVAAENLALAIEHGYLPEGPERTPMTPERYLRQLQVEAYGTATRSEAGALADQAVIASANLDFTEAGSLEEQDRTAAYNRYFADLTGEIPTGDPNVDMPLIASAMTPYETGTLEDQESIAAYNEWFRDFTDGQLPTGTGYLDAEAIKAAVGRQQFVTLTGQLPTGDPTRDRAAIDHALLMQQFAGFGGDEVSAQESQRVSEELVSAPLRGLYAAAMADRPDALAEGGEGLPPPDLYPIAFPGREISAEERSPATDRLALEEAMRLQNLGMLTPEQSAEVDAYREYRGNVRVGLDGGEWERRAKLIGSLAGIPVLSGTVASAPLAAAVGGAVSSGVAAILPTDPTSWGMRWLVPAGAAAPEDTEGWFQFSRADIRRALEALPGGIIEGGAGMRAGKLALSGARSWGGRTHRRLAERAPGRWGVEGVGGMVSDTGFGAVQDGVGISRLEGAGILAGGVLGYRLDAGRAGITAIEPGVSARRIVLPQIMGGGYVPATTPSQHVQWTPGVTPDALQASLSLRNMMFRQGTGDVTVGGLRYYAPQSRLDEALRAANPNIPIGYHSSPGASVFERGGPVPPMADKPFVERGTFIALGGPNPAFMAQSAYGGRGESPGIIVYGGPGFEKIAVVPREQDGSVKTFRGGHEVELKVPPGAELGPAVPVAGVGPMAEGRLYLQEGLQTPDTLTRQHANVMALLDQITGRNRRLSQSQRGITVTNAPTTEESIATGLLGMGGPQGQVSAEARVMVDERGRIIHVGQPGADLGPGPSRPTAGGADVDPSGYHRMSESELRAASYVDPVAARILEERSTLRGAGVTQLRARTETRPDMEVAPKSDDPPDSRPIRDDRTDTRTAPPADPDVRPIQDVTAHTRIRSVPDLDPRLGEDVPPGGAHRPPGGPRDPAW